MTHLVPDDFEQPLVLLDDPTGIDLVATKAKLIAALSVATKLDEKTRKPHFLFTKIRSNGSIVFRLIATIGSVRRR